MKLEVGMYIRTKEGIRKIESIYKNLYELNKSLHYNYPEGHDLYEEDIEEVVLKVSHTLLGNAEEDGVIEVGDYVNGYKVFEKDDYLWIERLDNHEIPHFTRLDYLDIKSIVTKEQFEQMQYKVGE